MTTRRALLTSVGASILTLSGPSLAWADDQLNVVATFSILGDMVEQVGGETVSVVTLVGPGGDAHVFSPTPQDARAVAEADVLFVNGLEFEGWLERLSEAAEFDGILVVATDGIEAIEYEDDHDPHAWQSPTLAVTYVTNIAEALSAADPDNAAAYQANSEAYIAEINALDSEVSAMMAAIPEDKRTIVTSHDAFGYFAAEYGLTFEAPQGVSTESEASAADVAALITQIREDGISAVFVESITDNRLIEQIATETGAVMGGTLYSDSLSAEDGPAGTYLDMIRHNAATISAALGG